MVSAGIVSLVLRSVLRRGSVASGGGIKPFGTARTSPRSVRWLPWSAVECGHYREIHPMFIVETRYIALDLTMGDEVE